MPYHEAGPTGAAMTAVFSVGCCVLLFGDAVGYG